MQNSTLFVLSTVAALLFATIGASACGGGPIGAAPNKVEQNKAAPTESAKELSEKLAREAETRCVPGAAAASLAAAELAAAAKMAATNVVRPLHDPASPPNERDPVEPVNRFVKTYRGGDCFFIRPVHVARSRVVIEGFGHSAAAFNTLDQEFNRTFGFEAAIGLNQVTRPQCPAVDFLSHVRELSPSDNNGGPRLETKVVSAGLNGAANVTGSIADLGDRHVVLLLVADDGLVYDLGHLLDGGGATKTFSVVVPRVEPTMATPQVLIAVVSDSPIAALSALQRAPWQGHQGDQLFAAMSAEAAQTGQALDALVKCIRL